MKVEHFYYKGKEYNVGAELWITGLFYVKGSTVFLKHEKGVFKYARLGGAVVFDVNGDEAWCSATMLRQSTLVECGTEISAPQEEFYLSKTSFNKLLLYIVVMLVGVIFYDRWLIWIGATIIFVVTTPEIRQFFKKNK